MTPAAFLYMGGMLALLIGERLVGGDDTLRYLISGVGGLLTLGSLGWVAKGRGSASAENKEAYSRAIMWGGVGLVGLVLYGLTLDPAVKALGLDDDAAHRYTSAMTAIWPIVWLAGTLPFLSLDRAIAASPILVTHGRVQRASMSALATAFAIAWVFPLNYLGTDLNKRWDLGYFKTAQMGSQTEALVQGVDQPIEVYLFFPSSSDVKPEIRGYFDKMEGQPNIQLSWVDHALEPELSKELKVRDNGSIAFVKRIEGEEEPQVERVKVGTDFDSAKRKLKKLDEEVNKAMGKLVRGKRVVYVTTGHGEMYWRGTDLGKKQKLSTLKKLLESLNYSVKELGLAEGLASEVPEDASLVMVLGPTEDFLEAEVSALNAYRNGGGDLLVALEPGGSALPGLLSPMGLSFDPTQTLASDKEFLLETRGTQDRVNLVTNKFSSHDSVTNVSRAGQQAVMALLASGPIEETKEGDAKVTVTVRSLPSVWGDLDGDYEKGTGESTKTHKIAAAVSMGEGEEESRSVVIGDATWASDAVLGQRMFANLQFLADSLSWLNEDASMAGTTESEEDVKIQHTREGQGWWFYATAVFLPFSFLGLGAARVRGRKRG